MGVDNVEKISYDEAREWFWVRTALWAAVSAVVSVMAHFAYSNGIIKLFHVRMWVSIGSGMGTVLLAILATTISLQFPWVRLGRRYAFLLNGPACAAISALMAFLVCGFILTFMQNDPLHPPSAALIDWTYAIMRFAIGAATVWGFVFGSWFVLRRDRYFVESI
jgi:hypothetical protein